MKLLVCYATRYGSTGEIAMVIGEELNAAGHRADTIRISDMPDPGPYDAVIIGSPLYMGKWLAEAREFVSQYRNVLVSKPVAVFTVGYSFKNLTSEHLRRGEEALEAVKLYIEPVASEFFAGSINPDIMRSADREITKLGGVNPGDYRNLDDVKRWAKNLPALLMPS